MDVSVDFNSCCSRPVIFGDDNNNGSFSPPSSTSASPSACASPILEFLFFHKAIRSELERLYNDSLAVENGGEQELQALRKRYEFLRIVYIQHSNAEDEVIFPALDRRVKNIAQTYSLEHKDENDLFDKMLALLNSALHDTSTSTKLRRDLICCTEAIQTTLCKHMSKEEEQVFPLLIQHLSVEEQAGLVWQFLCSIPVNLMEEFLPWLASCLSTEEQQEMITCMQSVVPKEELLRQVVFAWLKRANFPSRRKNDSTEEDGISRGPTNSTNVGEDTEERGCAESCSTRSNTLDNVSAETFKKHHFFPIDVILSWHKAIRKELAEFVQDAKKLDISTAECLTKFSTRLQFLAEVCIFHSAAEDKVIFPAIAAKSNEYISFSSEHLAEERLFDDIRRLIEEIQSKRGFYISSEISEKISTHVELITSRVQNHLIEEEIKVLPLARAHCTFREQQLLVYKSFLAMPLKLLERVLPWLVTSINEQEANAMLESIRLAAPDSHMALVTLLLGWACKGRAQNHLSQSNFKCIFLGSKGGCIGYCNDQWSILPHDSSPKTGTCNSVAADEKPSKRLRCCTSDKQECLFSEGDSSFNACRGFNTCCIPALGVGGSSLGFGAGTGSRSLQSLLPSALQTGYLGSGFFHLGSEPESPNLGSAPKPIDTIFQFHKAIRKDLEYLDDQSSRLMESDDGFLRQFTGRFQLLWGLYRAHSNAEDEIVFPALEGKEALHNVSRSYTIDHKHEEQLFKEISEVLSDLAELQACLRGSDPKDVSGKVLKWRGNSYSADNLMHHQQVLAAKLQGMCKSVHVTLDQHVSREEMELWPLFSLHFTIEEQEKLVGQIIGTTGAEVLQAMLPWVTTALSEEEQNTMMYTWRQATRNTMFDKWLNAWWKQSPNQSPQSSLCVDEDVPESGTPESLQVVADYLARDQSEQYDNVRVKHHMEDAKDDHGMSDLSIHEEVNGQRPEAVLDENNIISETQAKACDGDQAFKAKVEQGSSRFRPGWQDIFRMNEKELEAAVRKVSRDTSLDPRRKAYLMQNLMTSRWIVSQQRSSKAVVMTSHGDHEDIPGCFPSYTDLNNNEFGCEHYKRNCKVRAACCGVLFPCRFCHDKVSDHTMDRQAVQEMMCMKCLKVQPIGQYCVNPSCDGFCMAKYYCNICKLFDDRRDIYHCPSCNLCRVGKGLGIDFFHCMTCNACMSISLTSHRCRERGLESNCPICHDFLFTSHTPVKALSCGHFMHSACYKAYTYSHYTCPICCKSLGDMTIYFGMLDALLASEQLPEEYRDRQQDILCNDCEQKGSAAFHWLYHKCSKCGSYNTRTI